MKRIDIVYDGQRYSVGNRDYEDFRQEVQRMLSAGSGWLRVNDGDGARRDADLLVHAGVSLALIPVPDGDCDTL